MFWLDKMSKARRLREKCAQAEDRPVHFHYDRKDPHLVAMLSPLNLQGASVLMIAEAASFMPGDRQGLLSRPKWNQLHFIAWLVEKGAKVRCITDRVTLLAGPHLAALDLPGAEILVPRTEVGQEARSLRDSHSDAAHVLVECANGDRALWTCSRENSNGTCTEAVYASPSVLRHAKRVSAECDQCKVDLEKLAAQCEPANQWDSGFRSLSSRGTF